MQSFAQWFEKKENKTRLSDFLKDEQSTTYIKYDKNNVYFSFPGNNAAGILYQRLKNWLLHNQQVTTPVTYKSEEAIQSLGLPLVTFAATTEARPRSPMSFH